MKTNVEEAHLFFDQKKNASNYVGIINKTNTKLILVALIWLILVALIGLLSGFVMAKKEGDASANANAFNTSATRDKPGLALTAEAGSLDAAGNMPYPQPTPRLKLSAPVNQAVEIKNSLSTLAVMASEASGKVESALQEVEFLERENQRLTEELSQKESALTAFRDSLNKMNEQHVELESEVNELRRQNGKLMIEISDLRVAKKTPHAAVADQDQIEVIQESRRKNKASVKKRTVAKQMAQAKDKDSIKDLKIFAATNTMLVALQNGKPVSIPLGKKWNGIEFQSVDTNGKVVHTSIGDIAMSD